MAAIGVAILGAGIFAREAHIPAIHALGNSITLRAIYSRSESSAQSLATFAQSTLGLNDAVPIYHDGDDEHSLDVLLKRPDISALIIALPITTQPAIILKALKAGKHVLSEKPIAPDVQGGRDLIEAYEKEYKSQGLIWRIAENFEVETGLRAASQAIRDGKIGKVSLFNLSMVGYIDQEGKYYKTAWRTVPDYQGGFLLDGGVHFAAALRVLLPSPMVSLSAHASLTKEYLLPTDTINAIVRCQDGSHGIIELSFAAPIQSRSSTGIKITGTKGWMEVSPFKHVGKEGSYYKAHIHTDAGEEELVHKSDGVEQEIGYFIDVVSGKKDQGFGDPRGALMDVTLIEAALKSDGKPITLL